MLDMFKARNGKPLSRVSVFLVRSFMAFLSTNIVAMYVRALKSTPQFSLITDMNKGQTTCQFAYY